MNELQLFCANSGQNDNTNYDSADETCSDSDSATSEADSPLRINRHFVLHAVGNVEEYVDHRFEVERIRTSALTGKAYVEELLSVSTTEGMF